MKSLYFNQANLLLELVPFLNNEKDFALKGGSAINYFVRDYPRLSVDIDLTYLPVKNRLQTLSEISSMLERFSSYTREKIGNIRIIEKRLKREKFILSFKKLKPKWDLLEFDHIKNLPAIRWKLYNLSQMEIAKHKIALDKLANHLEVGLKGI